MSQTHEKTRLLSRASLLRQAGAAAATIGLAGCGGSDAVDTMPENTEATQLPAAPPSQAPLVCNVYSFLEADEVKTVEAFVARLIPGTADDPGAREACVVTYIDQKLAKYRPFAPTYSRAPFAKPVTSGAPGPQPNALEEIRVRDEELYRYGFQSDQTAQQAYRRGLDQLDRYSRRRFHGLFATLTEEQQDTIIAQLEAMNPENPPAKRKGPEARIVEEIFEKPSAYSFFSMLQHDAVEGMFADPVYGGNRDFAGWILIGYPGAQRAWTPEEVQNGPNKARRTQALQGLAAVNPGHPADHAILPIAGSERSTP